MLRNGLPGGQRRTSSADARENFKALVTCDRDGSPRQGVASPVHLNKFCEPVINELNMLVQPFSAVLRREGGVIFVANDDVSVVRFEAPPATNARIDVLAVRQNLLEDVTIADENDDAIFEVIKGAIAPSPVKPEVPDGSLELCEIFLPSTATSLTSPGVTIKETVPFTAAAGASVPFRNLAELQGWTTAAEGQQAHILETAVSQRFVYKNAAWIDAVPPLYACEKTHTATQSVAAGSGTTPLSWNTISYNRGGLVQSATQLRAPIAGVYQIEANFIVTNLQPIEVIGRFYKNGSAIAASEARSSAVTNAYKQVHLSVSLVLAAGDLITCGVAQWSGGALSVAPSSCRFLMRRLGD